MRRPLIALVLACLFSPAAQARFAPPAAPKRRPARLAHGVVAFAKRQLGVPYRWGGISRRTGFDCSGLVYAAYRSIGRKLPHSTWGARWPSACGSASRACAPATWSSQTAAATWCWWSRDESRSRPRTPERE
jgi:hypothetical protein